MGFKKILVANRGEIALRAIRECKELGIQSVAVFSDADSNALFVKQADEAYPIGESYATKSYLDMNKIINAAKQSKAEAIYPGYGFLAENPTFVSLCEQEGIKFIGPPAKAMGRAKPKHRARALMKESGIPVVPGTDEALDGDAHLPDVLEMVDQIGYPVIVKPSGAGGGIGIKVAWNRDELAETMKYAESRGKSAFGMASFYIEKYLTKIKHIEFQVMADEHGNVVHFGERECSVQRRYQKLIEEAPSTIMTKELREKMGADAVKVAKVLGYANALTVEFVYAVDTDEYYFGECNTRLQVEHPVTEMITGVNLVKEQFRIAAGEKLGYGQEDIQFRGWSIECRINAEDPAKGFVPSPGLLTAYLPPGGWGIRTDGGVYPGFTVSHFYDSLLTKLISWDTTREKAINCMKRALDEFIVEGLKTNIPFHKVALRSPEFLGGDYTTRFIDDSDIMTKV